ncbi:ATP-binding cassette domain-containing protein [Streptomyces cyaneus]|uniref:ATP-binding cassette domain-containing protein n=1 Tax=Streptomyces cyaneus TaxID=1904 RepID=UPI001FE97A5D|nr:ATP-binding cassette domain-containing protein [Streptomyces cyaneus]
MASTPVVEVSGLRKSYSGRPVVDGVSFAVEEGEIFGILGPNGAGKTTTVECVEGLRVPDAGRVRVTGLDPVADHQATRRVLGAQLQGSELQAKLTVREALELYAAFYPRPLDWRPLAERLGLTAKSTTRFAQLSGGQKQRLFIALALIGNPQHAAGARKRGDLQKEPPGGAFTEPSDHGLGRSRGGFTTKLHLAVEQGQKPMSIVITAGQRGDSPQFEPVLEKVRVPRIGSGRPRVRPDRVRADKAYASRRNRAHLRRRGIRCTIPDKADQARNRTRLGSRGGRPPRFDAEDYKARHAVECGINRLK